jgi:maltose O-acetyltransferase
MRRALSFIIFFWAMKLTALLPDFTPVMRFRGLLVRACFKRCGRNFQIASSAMVIHPSQVTIGDDVYVGYGVWIQGMGGVTLEDEVMLGPYAVLASRNHTRNAESYRFGTGVTAPIRIERGAWLGAHVVVSAGANVGRGALCAAGAIVTKDVPAHTVVGGVPARVLHTLAMSDTANVGQRAAEAT